MSEWKLRYQQGHILRATSAIALLTGVVATPLVHAQTAGDPATTTVLSTGAQQTPDSRDLSEVVVSATRSARAVDHIPGAVAVISSQDFANIQHSTLDPDEVLSQLIPGFTASSDDLTSNGELLRGKRPQFFLDGVPMSTPLKDVGRMSAGMVDPAVVQRIEVINGASAIEGLGGAGGIINYITKTPTKEGVVNTVETAAETQVDSEYFGWRANDLTMYKKDNLDFMLFLGTQSRPMYYDARHDLEYINVNGSYEDSKADEITAKLGYNFGEAGGQRIQVYFNNYDLNGNNNFNSLQPGNRALGIVQSAVHQPGPEPAAANHVREISATYTNTGIAGGTLTAIAYRGREAFQYNGSIDPEKQDPHFAPIGTLIDASDITSAKDGLKLYWERSDFLIQGFDMNFGYDYNEDSTAQNLNLTGRVWLPTLHFVANSGFIQMSLDRGPLTLSAGARYQSGKIDVPTFRTLYLTAPATDGVIFTGGSKNYNTGVYNLGAVYRLFSGWSTFVGFTQGYELPDIGTVIRNVNTPGQSMNTVPAVNPVVTNSYEAGANWRGSKASLSADVYYAKSPSSTLIVKDPNTLLQTVSRTPVEREGLEFSGDWRVIPTLSVSGSFSHMLAYTSLAPGLPADLHITPQSAIGQSPDKAVVRLDYNPIRRLSFDLTGTHFWGENLNANFAPSQRYFSTAYTLLDGSATYDMGTYGSLSLGCANMTNTFHIVNETGTNNTTYYAIQGRNYTITYKVTF